MQGQRRETEAAFTFCSNYFSALITTFIILIDGSYASTRTSTFLNPTILSKYARALEECLIKPSLPIFAFKYLSSLMPCVSTIKVLPVAL